MMQFQSDSKYTLKDIAAIMKGMDKSNYYIKKYIDDMFKKKYPRDTILKIMKESIIKQEKEF